MDTLGIVLVVILIIVIAGVILKLTGVITFSKDKTVCTRNKIELEEIGLGVFDVPMKDQVLLAIEDQNGNNVDGKVYENLKPISLPVTMDEDAKYTFTAKESVKGKTVYGIYGNCLI